MLVMNSLVSTPPKTTQHKSENITRETWGPKKTQNYNTGQQPTLEL